MSSLFLHTSTNALTSATAYRCVQLLSESVASLPLHYKRLKQDLFQDDTASRLYYLLTVQPNATISAFNFWKQAVEHILLQGNAYIVPTFNSHYEVESLILCDPRCVSHDVVRGVYTITDLTNNVHGTYAEEEIIHLFSHSIDGRQGVSVISYARLTLDIAQTGDSETLNRFAKGGNVKGLVTNDRSTRGLGEYQDKELARTAVNIDEKFNQGQKIVSLPGQVDFKQLSMSSTDMQFLESRKFAVRDICRFFGVHPSFVFDDTSNNYKSAEMANVAFLSNTLNPLLRNIENELLRKLVPFDVASKYCFEFDRRAIYAADLDSRVRYQTATIAAGLYTVNEWRKEENKPPVEGGDTPLVTANLRTITELSQDKTADKIDKKS